MTPHDLVAAFEAVAAAPDGIVRLRELILQLAVRGRLVQQDPDDEPASVVLERAKCLKAEAIARGDVPRAQALGNGTEGAVCTFAVPSGWAWARLEDVGLYIQRGKSPEYDDGSPARVVSQKCVQWSGFDLGRSRGVLESSLDDYGPERFLQAGDVLWNSTGTGTVGRVNLFPGAPSATRVVADSHVTVIRLAELKPAFVRMWLASPTVQQTIGELTTGTTKQQELNTSTVRVHRVPVPPLAEQHRIVARADELMGLLDRLEAARSSREATRAAARDSTLASLRQANTPDEVEVAWSRLAERMDELVIDPSDIAPLRQAVLELAVRGRLVAQDPADRPASELVQSIAIERAVLVNMGAIRKQVSLPPLAKDDVPFEVPRTWAWCRLGDVGDWGAGATPRRGSTEYYGGPHLWFKSGELPDGPLGGPSEETVTDRALAECSLRRNALGDVLIAMYGATIGKLALLTESATTNQAVCACTPLPGVWNRYLFVFLRAARARFTAAGAGGAQPNISKEKIVAFPFPLPPLAEQNRIVTRVDELMGLLDRLEVGLHAARTTHAAFAVAAVHDAVNEPSIAPTAP